jgi:hypothetical protein
MSAVLRPPNWVIPWSLVAGLLLTPAFLGTMNWKQISDCGQRSSPPYTLYSLPGGCYTIAESYPVRLLYTAPDLEANPGGTVRTASLGSTPIISKGALAEDWLVWSLVAFAVLYGLVVMERRWQVSSWRQASSGDGARLLSAGQGKASADERPEHHHGPGRDFTAAPRLEMGLGRSCGGPGRGDHSVA